MNQYEKILIEIGEKHKFEPGKGLGPELKLIGITLLNAAMFVGMKMLMNGAGNSLLEGLSTGFKSKEGTANKPSVEPSKRKMREPEINIDDF